MSDVLIVLEVFEDVFKRLTAAFQGFLTHDRVKIQAKEKFVIGIQKTESILDFMVVLYRGQNYQFQWHFWGYWSTFLGKNYSPTKQDFFGDIHQKIELGS